MKEIILAGGCFWGVEEFFRRLDGVSETEVCYVNGKIDNPTYELICGGNTNYAEACRIIFNEDIITFEVLLDNFWSIITPTSLNKQGNDIGSQYRTGIYYFDPIDITTIELSLEKEQKNHIKKIVTEVKPLDKYYRAEDSHQKYLQKNPNGYCHINFN
ncbi:peptide-methionine (S)-S-oxide reductase MsrA [uncultured Clostridium sp.]|jgi:peptide-methionine (S)-S-oxide reductase|uniref:peptide-methionine (S)-S-oxide reductase MsrA n=1 Tax=uncultured Clostridium sp. TaxID=59620 RepID=UPI0026171361|nr:peptide-methionine (S)-S-oxide reductase MsrA [uncultured Clostridium sp.]